MGPWSAWRKPGSAWRRRGGWRSSRGRASPNPPASPPSGTPRAFGRTSTPWTTPPPRPTPGTRRRSGPGTPGASRKCGRPSPTRPTTPSWSWRGASSPGGKLPPRHPERGRPPRPRGKPEPGGAPRQPPQGPVRGLREAVSLAGGLHPAPLLSPLRPPGPARRGLVWGASAGRGLGEGGKGLRRGRLRLGHRHQRRGGARGLPGPDRLRLGGLPGGGEPRAHPLTPWPTSPCGRGRWRGWRYSSRLPRKTRRKGTSLRPRSSPMRFFR